MQLGIVDCGLRIRRVGVQTHHDLPLPIRNPKSAIHICLLLAACTPVTTRPDFFPDPQALVVLLNARPERVTVGIDSLVAAESLEVWRSNVRDGYVETAWYDTRARRSRHHERDLEVILSKRDEGYKIAEKFVDKLKERFGVPKTGG